MKLIERMANDARLKWLGSKEQESNYYGNEFSAGYVSGFLACREMAESDLEFYTGEAGRMGEQQVEGESNFGFDTVVGDKWEIRP